MDIIVDSIHLDCMNLIKKEGIQQEYLVRGFQNESFKDFSFSKSLILNHAFITKLAPPPPPTSLLWSMSLRLLPPTKHYGILGQFMMNTHPE
mgnify:CR=1 FL=1